MQTTKSNNQLTLFSWNEDLLKDGLEQYKGLGYTLQYLRQELFSTKIGPFTTFTAVMSKPYGELTLVRAGVPA